MSRVIQDSDDELDEELEVDVHQPEGKDALSKQSVSDTSSTEALRRQIESAHRAHLQSQFPVNNGHTPVTVEVNYQKRKTLSDIDSKSTPGGKSVSKEEPINYSKRLQDISVSSPVGKLDDQSFLRQAPQPATTTSGIEWILEDTTHETYSQNDPTTVFPEPSSTVPNATLTQQRVLEGVLAPGLLGSDTDIDGAPFHPDASIPWSDYLKSPADAGEQPTTPVQESRVSQMRSAAMSESSSQEHSNPLQSLQVRQGSSIPTGSPLTHVISLDVLDTHKITKFPDDGDQTIATQPQDTLFSTVKGSTQEEFLSSHHQSRKKRPGSTPTSSDELADVAMPREQYKPRPSRSRSIRVGMQEPIDYSDRPERATKASKRRRSTLATTSTPDKIQQICDMGFTLSTSKRALKQNRGDITQSIDWLITNMVDNDELVSHTSQMSKSGGRSTDVAMQRQTDGLQAHHVGSEQTLATTSAGELDAMNHDAASAEPSAIVPVVDVGSPVKVQVVIPTRSPKTSVETPVMSKTSCKNSKPRKTTLDQPEPKVINNAVYGAKVEKKRGRGRPKKAAKAPASTDTVQDDGDEASQEQARNSPLHSADGNAQLATRQKLVNKHTTTATIMKASHGPETPQPQDATTSISRLTPELSVLTDRPEVEPITPKYIKKPAPEGHPSKNKTKVLYRVGLSKRARVAPLLRTVKK